jgi:hypothetical protein
MGIVLFTAPNSAQFITHCSSKFYEDYMENYGTNGEIFCYDSGDKDTKLCYL